MTYVPAPRVEKRVKRAPHEAANTLSGDNRVLRLVPEKPGSSVYLDISNGGGTFLVGVDQDEGGNLFEGVEPNAAAFGTVGPQSVHVAANGRIWLTIRPDGTVLVAGRDVLTELDAALNRIADLESKLEGGA